MIYSLLDERKLEDLRRDRQVDFSFGVSGLGRFRANAFSQRGTLALALRVVPFRVRSLEELGTPVGVHDAAQQAVRHRARGGPDRLGQVDHARGDDRSDQRRPSRCTS